MTGLVTRYLVRELTTGLWIALNHGEKGFYRTDPDYVDDNYVEGWNAKHGYTEAHLKAASICSMTGDWGRFDEIVETFDEVALRQVREAREKIAASN